jgi:hypothetical protein
LTHPVEDKKINSKMSTFLGLLTLMYRQEFLCHYELMKINDFRLGAERKWISVVAWSLHARSLRGVFLSGTRRILLDINSEFLSTELTTSPVNFFNPIQNAG